MDPSEALRLWSEAVESKDREAALDHATDLANWLNNGGFEPRWSAELKAEFWRWWDATFDATTVYEDPTPCPKCGAPMRACATGEPDEHCDACGHVEPLAQAAERLLGELEEAGIAEAGTGNELHSTGVQVAADALRTVLQTIAKPEPTPGEWRCPDCGGNEIEGTAWVVLNTNKPTGDEPPSDDLWCPGCEGHPWVACCVERATGQCTMHVESAGPACHPKHKEGEQP